MEQNHTKKAPPPVSRVLVFDDEEEMLANYRTILEQAGHNCRTSQTPGELDALLSEFRPDLVLTDLQMPKYSGVNVLERVQRTDPSIPVIIVTGHGTVESAVRAMKLNAAGYLTKPFAIDELLAEVQHALSPRLVERAARIEGAAAEKDPAWRKDIVGSSLAIEKALGLARKVARTDVNLLILGESGTGKEVFARAIHRLSPRRDEVLVPVDCASLPENLLESELFGYRKGAFTGADADKVGLFKCADGGTLFLDEIAEIPLPLQSKLLRVLQERQFRPIGGNQEIAIDIRVIAATNRDLRESMRNHTFRSDLYYRLDVITLRLPPLRERHGDIAELANHFLAGFARQNRLDIEFIDSEAMRRLEEHNWPGNVRELRNAIESAATLTSGHAIALPCLKESLRAHNHGAAPIPAAKSSYFFHKTQALKTFEREYLISLLAEHHFNVSRAAATAGCSRRTIYRAIHRNRLDIAELRKHNNK